MLLGHLALGVAAKPLSPRVPLWALLVAAMLMDFLFNLLVLAGIEAVSPSGTRSFPPQNDQFHYHDYSHSLLVAVGLSLVVLLVYRAVWGARTPGQGVRKSWAGGLVLAVLVFSHWPADVLTHLPEMPILPGNWGELPTIGLELAAKPPAALVVEVIMAVAAVAVYFFWAKRTRPSARWYVGPAIAAGLLALTVPFTA
jgi:phosphoglycerol transferase MdoB-like AlkP superfamily enzyme